MGKKLMNSRKSFEQVLESIWSGIKYIFGVNRDDYPTTGVQPYEDDIPSKKDQNALSE